jgi:hypothetical protein
MIIHYNLLAVYGGGGFTKILLTEKKLCASCFPEV